MVSAGTFPPRKPQDAELSPRVGDGLVRLDSIGRVIYASPNALSAYRRIGVPGDLVGADFFAVTAAAAADRVAGEAAAAGSAAALDGRSPTRWTSRPTAHDLPAGAAAAAAGRTAGRARPGPRRHRRAAPRSGAADQGRDHPRDPPPREEQPADRGRAAAAAGPSDDRARGAAALEESVRRVPRSPWCTRRWPAAGRTSSPSTRCSTGCCRCWATDLDRPPAARHPPVGRFGELSAAVATPLVMAVTELLHNAAEHAFADGRGRRIELVAERTATTSSSECATTVAVCRPASIRRRATGLGLQIVRTLVASELDGALDMRAPAPARAPRRCSSFPGREGAAEAETRSRPESRAGLWWLRSASPGRGRGVRRCARGSGPSALECAPLVLGQSAPDARVLASAQRPVQARLRHGATAAHGLRLLDLHEGRAGRPDREEQLRVLVPAERAVAPVHGCVLLGVVYGVVHVGLLRWSGRPAGSPGLPALCTAIPALLPAGCVPAAMFSRPHVCQGDRGVPRPPREQAHHARDRRATRRNEHAAEVVDSHVRTCVRNGLSR